MYRSFKSRLTQQHDKSRESGQEDREERTSLVNLGDGDAYGKIDKAITNITYDLLESNGEDQTKKPASILAEQIQKKYPSGFNPFGSDEEDIKDEKVTMELEKSDDKKYPSGFNPFGSDEEDVIGEKDTMELVKSDNKKYPSGFNPFGSDEEDVIDEKVTIELVKSESKKYPSGFNPFGSDEEDFIEEKVTMELEKNEKKKYPSGFNPFGSDEDDIVEKVTLKTGHIKKNYPSGYNPFGTDDEEVKKEKMKEYKDGQDSGNKYPKESNPFGSDGEVAREENVETLLKGQGGMKYKLNPFESDNYHQEYMMDVQAEHSEMNHCFNPYDSDDEEFNKKMIRLNAYLHEELAAVVVGVKAGKTYNAYVFYDADDEDDDKGMFGLTRVSSDDDKVYTDTTIMTDPNMYEDYSFGVLGIYASGQEDRPVNDVYGEMVEEYDDFVYGVLGSSRYHVE